MRLANKTALVTGAASGFGMEIARRFIEEGASVAFVDINAEGARAAVDAVASSIAPGANAKAIALTCDVTDGAQVRASVNDAIEAFGRVDIVVNNAGWTHHNQPLLETSEADFRRVYDINVTSIFHMAHAAVPHWRSIGGGAMINIGSTAALRPRPGLTWYNSTKGAVTVMSKSMALELAPDKIRVNCIAPVMSATGLLERFMGCPDTPENRARFVATVPLGRLSEPRDIANAALYLASDEAEFVTGVILEIDGGRCA